MCIFTDKIIRFYEARDTDVKALLEKNRHTLDVDDQTPIYPHIDLFDRSSFPSYDGLYRWRNPKINKYLVHINDIFVFLYGLDVYIDS